MQISGGRVTLTLCCRLYITLFKPTLFKPTLSFDCLHQARSAAPCVVFFDEMDSVAKARGHHSEAGKFKRRVMLMITTCNIQLRFVKIHK
jgi:hypothetical protein